MQGPQPYPCGRSGPAGAQCLTRSSGPGAPQPRFSRSLFPGRVRGSQHPVRCPQLSLARLEVLSGLDSLQPPTRRRPCRQAPTLGNQSGPHTSSTAVPAPFYQPTPPYGFST
ncbi:hypothetical protein NDU88_004268 [Pleurodeles waltl]|uniref:Uncharacterized protein n=1 Tax=Pleurodeles waltl TaxID=8319 RepID=A0AAV7PCA2_PLEWA|nr:hypothetical protein NDU88_004268 [Pleurodeles waltl]